MNLEDLQKKLLAAARSNPPEDRVPYAFEKRILSRLSSQPAADSSALWARALWRAAVPCVAVTLLLTALSFTMASTETTTVTTVTSEADISQQFELALLAPANQLEEIQ
ncbi:MAG TPA: hypothetical protein VFZ59_11750 [Verrucomicrobiae bacterium]|nr:hypothetical protein [Verrucomicrobiae bacterium]